MLCDASHVNAFQFQFNSKFQEFISLNSEHCALLLLVLLLVLLLLQLSALQKVFGTFFLMHFLHALPFSVTRLQSNL